MSKTFVQNKYNPGDIVYAKVKPSQGLIIRRYVDEIYYCKVQKDPDRKELVYFEREIVRDQELVGKNKKLRQNALSEKDN